MHRMVQLGHQMIKPLVNLPEFRDLRCLRLEQRPELGRQQASIKVIGNVRHGRRIA